VPSRTPVTDAHRGLRRYKANPKVSRNYRDPRAYEEAANSLLLRDLPENQEQNIQNELGWDEHKAYAKHRVREKPLLGLLEQMVAIPGYEVAKATGLKKGRSKGGLDSLLHGLGGVAEGTMENLGDILSYLAGDRKPIGYGAVYKGNVPISKAMKDSGLLEEWMERRKDDPVEPMQPTTKDYFLNKLKGM